MNKIEMIELSGSYDTPKRVRFPVCRVRFLDLSLDFRTLVCQNRVCRKENVQNIAFKFVVLGIATRLALTQFLKVISGPIEKTLRGFGNE